MVGWEWDSHSYGRWWLCSIVWPPTSIYQHGPGLHTAHLAKSSPNKYQHQDRSNKPMGCDGKLWEVPLLEPNYHELGFIGWNHADSFGSVLSRGLHLREDVSCQQNWGGDVFDGGKSDRKLERHRFSLSNTVYEWIWDFPTCHPVLWKKPVRDPQFWAWHWMAYNQTFLLNDAQIGLIGSLFWIHPQNLRSSRVIGLPPVIIHF